MRREFGKALITFYIRLLEVIDVGKRILKILESGGDYLYYEIERCSLKDLLTQQSLNVERLSSGFLYVQHEIRVPEVAEKMSIRIDQKSNVLRDLAAFLREGLLPTRILLRLPNEDDRSWFDDRNIDISIIDLFKEHQVGLENEVYEELGSYLGTDNPREQLKTMVRCADQIRELLVQEFKLEEILWGTEQLRDEGTID